MKEKDSQERLIERGAVKKVAPLLVDQDLPVREAAASLLRWANFSAHIFFCFSCISLFLPQESY